MDSFPAFLPLAGRCVVVIGSGEAADAKARLFDGSPATVIRLPGADRDVLADVPWPAVLYTGLLSTDAVLLIEVVALRAVSSTDAAIVYTTEPVLGALLAAAFLGERPTLSAYVGAAIILVSAFTAQVAGAVGNGKQE